jgi:LPXTG-motif cell wall-anchored protein
MKRLLVLSVVLVLSLALATSALAQDMARVRVVHASPDAPAVDVWVNGNVAFSNAPFTGITDYASLAAGSYQVQVTPTGATEPIVIDATLDLAAGTDYTVVAVGQLANIEPLVLVDNNSAPAAGKAHVRFVHASPDAPAVDIAVTGGPVLFSNVPFKGVGDYLPVDAGTYDLEARVAGTENVALSVPGVQLNEGTVYTIFAMGLAGGGEPALTAVPSVDAVAPTQLPETGGEVTSLWLVASLVAGLALIGGGLVLRRKNEIAA